MYLYRIFGFDLQSEVELPELGAQIEVQAAAPIAAQIRLCDVPDELPDGTVYSEYVSFAPDRCLYRIPDVCRMMIVAGTTIYVDRDPSSVAWSEVRTFVLGTGLGTLLHQRRMIPLHVGVVISPAGAIAFTGPSGAGKSTVVANLYEALGWPILGDDLAALGFADDTPVLTGGIQRLRLWKDALQRLGWTTEGLMRDTHRHDKFVSFEHGRFAPGPEPFIGLYEIQPSLDGGDPIVCSGAKKFEMVMNAVYRPFVVRMNGDYGRLHHDCARTASKIRCWRGPRPTPEMICGIVSNLT